MMSAARDDPLSREVEAREYVRRTGSATTRVSGRRQRGLPDREPDDLPERFVGEHVGQRGEVERAVGGDPTADDRGDGVHEEHAEERDGYGEHATAAAQAHRRQRSTMSVHSLDPVVTVRGDVVRRKRERVRGHRRVLREHRWQRRAFHDGVDEHLERHVLLESAREHEVDEPACRLLVRRCPSRIPANSICRKQVSTSAAVGARFGRRVGEHDLSGRARGVRHDERVLAVAGARRRTPRCTPAPNRRRPRRRCRGGAASSRSSPRDRTRPRVASRNASPGEEVAAFSTTSRSRYSGRVSVSSVSGTSRSRSAK